MPEVYASIGSNIDREANVREALRMIEESFGTLVVSSIYETESVGFSGPNFYNLVAGFTTGLSLPEVEEILAGIEAARGRRRNGERFDDRTLDIDVLLYGDLVDEGAGVPRADILNYAFVLCPLAEIAGDRVHPVCGRSYAALWADFGDASQKVWPVADPDAEQAAEPSRLKPLLQS